MFHRLHVPEGELAKAVRGFVAMSALDAVPGAPDARFNRFPAMPFCGVTLITDGAVALVDEEGRPGETAPPWLVFGPRTRPVTSLTLAPLRSITAIFHASAFRRLTGCEPALLRDRDDPAGDWLPPEWQEWPAALCALAHDPDAQFSWMERWLLPRWQAVRGSTAGSAGIGARQRQRRSRALAGLGPTQLQRLARIELAIAQLKCAREDAPLDLARLAAHLGYADQAHFTRDVKALTGLPPARLARALCADPVYWADRIE